ncbi:FCD domain-containing protein [Sulfitobacter sp. LCG007]
MLRLIPPIEFGSSLPTGAGKEAVATLGRMVANDVYPQGELMPTEPELAKLLGVSRTTIRDAIKVLSGKGMIRTARRYGTRVRPVEEWNLLDADVAAWHDPAHPRLRLMFTETTELRCILEPAAAELAAVRATETQVRTILDAARCLDPGSTDMQALFSADCTFHATILDATGNLMMRQMRPIILTMLRISYEVGVTEHSPAMINRAGHIRVGEAISARDAPAARKAMQQMLDHNRSSASSERSGLLSSLRQSGGS